MRTATTLRPCTGCGFPTRSALRLCRDCRPSAAQRPERPCTGCGKRTTAKKGVCLDCLRPDQAGVEAIPCTECGIELTVTGACKGCQLALADDRGKRPGESAYDMDDLGTWRFDPVRRIQVWVPTPPPEPEPWPGLWDDSEASAARRMQELVNDVKTRPRKAA
jgi:hypothetical protein